MSCAKERLPSGAPVQLLMSICSGPLAAGVVGGGQLQYQCVHLTHAFKFLLFALLLALAACSVPADPAAAGVLCYVSWQAQLVSIFHRVPAHLFCAAQRVWTCRAAGQSHHTGGVPERAAGRHLGARPGTWVKPSTRQVWRELLRWLLRVRWRKQGASTFHGPAGCSLSRLVSAQVSEATRQLLGSERSWKLFCHAAACPGGARVPVYLYTRCAGPRGPAVSSPAAAEGRAFAYVLDAAAVAAAGGLGDDAPRVYPGERAPPWPDDSSCDEERSVCAAAGPAPAYPPVGGVLRAVGAAVRGAAQRAGMECEGYPLSSCCAALGQLISSSSAALGHVLRL